MTNIGGERAALKAAGLVMRHRGEWGATANYTNDRPCDVPATLLVAHIAVVDDPGDLLGTEDQVARNIERIGISRFPATGISYNALAFNTGRLYEGQPLTRRGAHTVNDRQRATCSQAGCPSQGDSLTAPGWNNNINARSCVAPQMPGDPCTDAQVDAFARFGAGLKRAGHATRDARWHGHRCFAAKDCPSPQVWARLDEIAALTEHYTIHGLGDDDMPITDAEMNAIVAKVWDFRIKDPDDDATAEPGPPAASHLRWAAEYGERNFAILNNPTALADALAPLIAAELPDPTELTQTQIQAACEVAIRDVLGGLDSP